MQVLGSWPERARAAMFLRIAGHLFFICLQQVIDLGVTLDRHSMVVHTAATAATAGKRKKTSHLSTLFRVFT